MSYKLPEIKIIRDTREQQGWVFEPEEKVAGKVQITGTVEQMLDAADYSFVGGEELVRLERKQGFCELFTNLMTRENRLRFERELEKLKPIKHKYILVESSLNDDLLGLTVPQYKFGGPPLSKITDMLFEYQLAFDIHPIFAGTCGKKIASQIFKNVARKYL